MTQGKQRLPIGRYLVGYKLLSVRLKMQAFLLLLLPQVDKSTGCASVVRGHGTRKERIDGMANPTS